MTVWDSQGFTAVNFSSENRGLGPGKPVLRNGVSQKLRFRSMLARQCRRGKIWWDNGRLIEAAGVRWVWTKYPVSASFCPKAPFWSILAETSDRRISSWRISGGDGSWLGKSSLVDLGGRTPPQVFVCVSATNKTLDRRRHLFWGPEHGGGWRAITPPPIPNPLLLVQVSRARYLVSSISYPVPSMGIRLAKAGPKWPTEPLVPLVPLVPVPLVPQYQYPQYP